MVAAGQNNDGACPVLDTPTDKPGEPESLSPQHIAENAILSPREKIDLLTQLKANVTGLQLEGDNVGFDATEVDAAIEAVRSDAQDGVGAEPAPAPEGDD